MTLTHDWPMTENLWRQSKSSISSRRIVLEKMDSSWSQLRVATFQRVLGLPCNVISIAFAWKAWASKHLTQMPKQLDWLVSIHTSSFSTISPSHMTKRVTLALRVSPAPSGGSWFLLLTSAKFFFSSLPTQVWMRLSMIATLQSWKALHPRVIAGAMLFCVYFLESQKSMCYQNQNFIPKVQLTNNRAA